MTVGRLNETTSGKMLITFTVQLQMLGVLGTSWWRKQLGLSVAMCYDPSNCTECVRCTSCIPRDEYPAGFAAGNAAEVISMGVLAQLCGLIIMYPWAGCLMSLICISFVSSYLKMEVLG